MREQSLARDSHSALCNEARARPCNSSGVCVCVVRGVWCVLCVRGVVVCVRVCVCGVRAVCAFASVCVLL